MGLAIVADESVFQALVLMAGHFTEVDVDAMGVLFQVFGLVWAVWWGLGLATQISVGRNLGKGYPKAVRLLTTAVVSVASRCIVARPKRQPLLG